MLRDQIIGQLKRNWVQLEIAKREKTNELWILEAQIEKIKSKLKSYGMDESVGLDQEFIAVWEGTGISSSSSCNCSDAIRNNGMQHKPQNNTIDVQQNNGGQHCHEV